MPWRVTSPMHERPRFVLETPSTPLPPSPSSAGATGSAARAAPSGASATLVSAPRVSPTAPTGPSTAPMRPGPASSARFPPSGSPGAGALASSTSSPSTRTRPMRSPSDRRFTASSSSMAASRAAVARRTGLSRARRRPRSPAPNVAWSVDFKGQFKLDNGRYCYPLTVQDAYSRFLLTCEGLDGPRLQPTQLVFRRLFREHGRPARIRSDNGQPFASCALGRLSQLGVWWLQLGVRPSSSSPPRRSRMAATNGCIAISRLRPHGRPRAPSAPSSADSTPFGIPSMRCALTRRSCSAGPSPSTRRPIVSMCRGGSRSRLPTSSKSGASRATVAYAGTDGG